MKKIITYFYTISEALEDDYELICDFIIYITNTKMKRKRLMHFIEVANYEKFEDEILQCMDNLHKAKIFN